MQDLGWQADVLELLEEEYMDEDLSDNENEKTKAIELSIMYII